MVFSPQWTKDEGPGTDHAPRTKDQVVAAFLLAFVVLPLTSAAQTPSSWFGSWSLNVARSAYDPGPPPYTRATYTIEPWGVDGMKVIYEMVHPRGGVTHLEWQGRIDGKDYPLQGIDAFVTYAYNQVSPGVYGTIVKMGGRVAAKSTVTVSADGKTMTTTTKGVDSSGRVVTTVTVYERQQ
jgi:hypothetical protein